MLKNLKSIFIVEEPSSQAAPAAKAKPAPAAAKPAPAPAAPTPVGDTQPGKITPKFTDILLAAMEKVNIEGFDYLEYKKSLQSLQKMNMDEATAFQSAYVMAQTMGTTPAHLAQTAGHYLQALKSEEEKFNQALVSQREARVGAKLEEQKQLQAGIKDKSERIRQLQAEIAQHQASLTQLDSEIQQATHTIEQTKNDFFASYQNLMGQIQADVEKMQRYLK